MVIERFNGRNHRRKDGLKEECSHVQAFIGVLSLLKNTQQYIKSTH